MPKQNATPKWSGCREASRQEQNKFALLSGQRPENSPGVTTTPITRLLLADVVFDAKAQRKYDQKGNKRFHC